MQQFSASDVNSQLQQNQNNTDSFLPIQKLLITCGAIISRLPSSSTDCRPDILRRHLVVKTSFCKVLVLSLVLAP